MKYCGNCGAPVELRIPAGDDRQRYICAACGSIHYQNPKLVVGCLAEFGDRVLLCRRAIEPRLGFWTLPAGFMENGETVEEAAVRETAEEARARVEILSLFSVVSLPHIDQVYMLFRGRLQDDDFAPGHETLEACLFREEDIPWDELAFSSIAQTLDRYFKDRGKGFYQLHTLTIRRPMPRR